jgi:hypothetical protein
MAADDSEAVMWECPDIFPLDDVNLAENGGSPLWVMKYSIGPGPAYDQPWGTIGPRDYYVTGSYNPMGGASDSAIDFQSNGMLWAAAMNRSRLVVLDIGAFYASKSYKVPEVGRVLWGWLPEERLVDAHGEPYGWAGAMSFPRVVIPYQDTSPNSPWYVRTVPLQSALDELRVDTSFTSLNNMSVDGTTSAIDSNFITVSGVSGNQLELLSYISVDGMKVGDTCGLRVLSTVSLSAGTTSDVNGQINGNWVYEFTDIGVQFTDADGGVDALGDVAAAAVMFVDPVQSTTNTTALVNRTRSDAYPIDIASSSYYVDADKGGVALHVLVDKSVLEIFLANGTRVATRRVYPSAINDAVNVQLFSRCGDGPCQCTFAHLSAWKLRSANISDSEEIVDELKNSNNNDDDGLSESTLIIVIVVPMLFGCGFLIVAGWIWLQRQKVLTDTSNVLLENQK